MKKLYEALKDFELFDQILGVQNEMTRDEQQRFLDHQLLKHSLLFATISETFGEKVSGAAELAFVHLLLTIRNDDELSDECCGMASVLIGDQDWVVRQAIEIAKFDDAYYEKTKDILILYRPEFLQNIGKIVSALAAEKQLTEAQQKEMLGLYMTGFFLALEIVRRAYIQAEESAS